MDWKEAATRAMNSANESGRRRGYDRLPTTETIEALLEKNPDLRCPYCKRIIDWVRMSIDHVIPLAGGGQHTVENLAFTCRRCNLYKKSMPPEVWQLLHDTLKEKGLLDLFFEQYQPRHFGG
jgi:5-methylcytosine-specific restriction endonuclease McrA